MTLIKQLLLVLFTLACLMTKPVFAHKLNAAETSVNYNSRNNSVEIVHRFYLHDVNHLIQQHYKRLGTQADSQVDSADKYQVFTDYILNNTELALATEDSGKLEILYVGAEQESKYFFIYQEISSVTSSDIRSFAVNIKAMQNQWKPKYWLYQVKLTDNKANSFVLDHKELSKRIFIVR